MAYLAEVRYAERYGGRLSDADWFSWKHGPYSKRIVNGVREMPTRIVRHESREVYGKVANYYSPGPDCAPTLPPEVASLLDDVISVYGNEDTQAIVSAAYRTAPFSTTPAGRKIRMDEWASTLDRLKNSPEIRAKIRAAMESETASFSSIAELIDFLNDVRFGNGGT